MDWVGFPGLGIERIFLPAYVFKIFGLEIGFYSIIFSCSVAIGIFFSWFFSEKFGVLEEEFFGAAFVGLTFGIFGARLYYIVFNLSEYFNNESIWQNLFEIINLRRGGVAIYGGIIFSISAGMVFCRVRNIKILPELDLAAIGFSIGQSVGRWGNFFNVEAYGIKTNLPWGMVSNKIPSYLNPVHPTFFYESFWCGCIFILLLFWVRFRKFDGEIFLIYLALYSLERFFVEWLRTDSLMFFKTNIRVSQLVSLIFFVCSVSLLIFCHFKLRNSKKNLFVETEEFKNRLKNNMN